MHRAQDTRRMPGPIQEVWVSERDMGRAGFDLLPDVPEDHIFRYQEKTASVDRDDRDNASRYAGNLGWLPRTPRRASRRGI